jgi:hypothetical protein
MPWAAGREVDDAEGTCLLRLRPYEERSPSRETEDAKRVTKVSMGVMTVTIAKSRLRSTGDDQRPRKPVREVEEDGRESESLSGATKAATSQLQSD